MSDLPHISITATTVSIISSIEVTIIIATIKSVSETTTLVAIVVVVVIVSATLWKNI